MLRRREPLSYGFAHYGANALADALAEPCTEYAGSDPESYTGAHVRAHPFANIQRRAARPPVWNR